VTVRRIWPLVAGLVLVVVLLFAARYVQAYLPLPGFLARQPAPTPVPAATRDGRWQQAVEYLGSQLPALHVEPYFKTDEAAIQASVRDLASRVPELSDEAIVVGLMRIVASLGDGHTRAFPEAEPVSYRRLPLELMWLDDGLIVTAADAAYAEALGTKVVAIGGRPVDAVDAAVAPLIAADNDMERRNGTPRYIVMPSVLYGLGLIPDPAGAPFTFETQDGRRFDRELRPARDPGAPLVSVYEHLGIPTPLSEQDRRANYWYRHLPDADAVYVQYNVCAEAEGRPFAAFVDELFALVDREQVERLILDVRFNGGGNEAVLSPFIDAVKARPQLNAPGRLFVIIGRGTYSSALQNAITLHQETAATLVGEPTGGKPNHYGEVRRFRLPNAGLLVQYSTRYWRNYPEGDPPTLAPDRYAAATHAALLAGRDPALEAALAE
jgi:hypothetical protein